MKFINYRGNCRTTSRTKTINFQNKYIMINAIFPKSEKHVYIQYTTTTTKPKNSIQWGQLYKSSYVIRLDPLMYPHLYLNFASRNKLSCLVPSTNKGGGSHQVTGQRQTKTMDQSSMYIQYSIIKLPNYIKQQQMDFVRTFNLRCNVTKRFSFKKGMKSKIRTNVSTTYNMLNKTINNIAIWYNQKNWENAACTRSEQAGYF